MSASLTDLQGVGPVTARLLTEAGFPDVASIAAAQPADLEDLSGIGSVRAASLQAQARQLLGRGEEPAPAPRRKTPKKRKKKARKLRKQAKQLRKESLELTERARSTKSKKKRKRRLQAAADLEATARKVLRKAKKLERK